MEEWVDIRAGGYRLTKLIGVGGMGGVSKATVEAGDRAPVLTIPRGQ